MSEWTFSAQIEDDGDMCLEWYQDKGNVVTVCFSAQRKEINWAALIEHVAHHGHVRETTHDDATVKHD